MKSICKILLVSLAFLLTPLAAHDGLKQLSYKERSYLEHFFRRNITWSHFGYVLFFSEKAIALTSVHLKKSRHFEASLADRGWDVWKRYEHLFPHPNFIFCEEDVADDYFQLILVNKTTLRAILTKYEATFKGTLDETYSRIFGHPFTPDFFIETLEKHKRLYPLVLDDKELIGLLMGFGPESSLSCKHAVKEAPFERIPSLSQALMIHGKNGVISTKSFGVRPVVFSGNPGRRRS